LDYYRKGLKHFGLIEPPKDGPAILLYDIETAPALCWDWTPWQSNVVAVEQDPYMLSFAYKWLEQKRVGFVSIRQDPKFKPDTDNDFHVAVRLARLMDRAHIVIAHNGDKFDRKKLNTALRKHDLDPPSPYRTIDTLKAAKREFSFFKNNLNELGRSLDLGGKVPHNGFDLWRDCMRGDRRAWKLMEKYNKQDVVLLEKLYLKLRPWIGLPGTKAHPNLGFWTHDEKPTCPKCGGKRLWKRGIHRTTVSEFQTFQCQGCKGYSRSRIRESQRGQHAAAKVHML
jgi:hypothetical protein